MKQIKPIEPLMYVQSQRDAAKNRVFAIIFSILTGFMLGFVVGSYYQKRLQDNEVIKLNASRAMQYSVLDSERVVTSEGDTVKYNWNKLTRK